MGSSRIKDLTFEIWNYKLLEENIGKFFNIGFGSYVFDLRPKTTGTTAKLSGINKNKKLLHNKGSH